jgi:hypothetical protein
MPELRAGSLPTGVRAWAPRPYEADYQLLSSLVANLHAGIAALEAAPSGTPADGEATDQGPQDFAVSTPYEEAPAWSPEPVAASHITGGDEALSGSVEAEPWTGAAESADAVLEAALLPPWKPRCRHRAPLRTRLWPPKALERLGQPAPRRNHPGRP